MLKVLSMPTRTPVDDGLYHVAIVGCGFTGAAAAVALLNARIGSLRLTIVEPAEKTGAGLAYGRAAVDHLLNARACDLTIDAEKPDDFIDWMGARLSQYDGMVEFADDLRDAFLPRRIFGNYAHDRLLEAIAAHPETSVEIVPEAARAIERGRQRRWRVLAGRSIEADVVVLATGFGEPSRRLAFGPGPYDRLDPERLEKADTGVIVGSGLSMADGVSTLRRLGFTGRIKAVSRHGAMPARHSALRAGSAEGIRLPASAAGALRLVRRAAAEAEAAGLSWQAVFNGLRPETRDFWLRLGETEQRRFLRHLQCYWEIHRHRLPPAVHRLINSEVEAGQLQIVAGRVLHVDPSGPHVRMRLRGKREKSEIRADIVLDCSGYRADLSAPPVATLIDARYALRDPHGQGIAVAKDGRVLAYSGQYHNDLFALGPLGRGSLYEITAVPEIVSQGRDAARLIARLAAGVPMHSSRRQRR